MALAGYIERNDVRVMQCRTSQAALFDQGQRFTRNGKATIACAPFATYRLAGKFVGAVEELVIK